MTEKADPELVTTGPYSLVRHPIYTGMIAAMIGTALAVSLWYLIVAAMLGGYFVYSAVNEECYMTSRFPTRTRPISAPPRCWSLTSFYS